MWEIYKTSGISWGKDTPLHTNLQLEYISQHSFSRQCLPPGKEEGNFTLQWGNLCKALPKTATLTSLDFWRQRCRQQHNPWAWWVDVFSSAHKEQKVGYLRETASADKHITSSWTLLHRCHKEIWDTLKSIQLEGPGDQDTQDLFSTCFFTSFPPLVLSS